MRLRWRIKGWLHRRTRWWREWRQGRYLRSTAHVAEMVEHIAASLDYEHRVSIYPSVTEMMQARESLEKRLEAIEKRQEEACADISTIKQLLRLQNNKVNSEYSEYVVLKDRFDRLILSLGEYLGESRKEDPA